jgi:hypothetical protein
LLRSESISDRRQVGQRQRFASEVSVEVIKALAGNAGKLVHQHGSVASLSTMPQQNSASQRGQALTTNHAPCQADRRSPFDALHGGSIAFVRQNSGMRRTKTDASANASVRDRQADDRDFPMPADALPCKWVKVPLNPFHCWGRQE